MPATIAETRDRVASMLAGIVGPVQLGPDGTLSFPYESTRVFVTVRPLTDVSNVVDVVAMTNVDLELSYELCKYVALHGDDWVFGHLALKEDEGKGYILFRHVLLADYLDQPELATAVAGVATTADRIDDEIKAQFGGRLPAETPAG